MKTVEYYGPSNSLIAGILLNILGFVLIFLNEKFYKNIVMIFVYILLLIGIRNFISYFLQRNTEKNKKTSFLNCLFNLLFALFLSLNQNISLSILPIAIGIYFLFNFILQLISFIIIVRNKDTGSLYKLLLSFIYLFVAIILICTPLRSIDAFLIVSGLYFVFLGFNYIYDFITQIIPIMYKNKIKRRIRLTLPVVIESIIPYRALNYINKILEVNEKVPYEEKKNSDKVDLEIFVHVSPNGFNRMGHVDLFFDNEVISYGNYDRSSIKAKEIFGDGVLFTAPRDKYLPFVIEHSNKTIFAFGLSLTDKQISRVRTEIEKIKKDLVVWEPNSKKYKKGKYTDYASILYNKTKANFYKFKRGKFKTYFVLGTNCCLLADRIIGKSGLDLLKMNGLITPGTYYEYLNKEFNKKGSIVVSKNIYNEKRKK